MKRDYRLYVQDVIDSIAMIETYTRGVSFEEFAADQMRVDAVVRNFEIIGEASTHIPSELKDQHPSVPWARVRSFRNIMIHEYFGVDLSILWQTIKDSLPELKAVVMHMTKEMDES